MAEKNVHGGHRKRLRDRAMLEGLDHFDPHQVIELLLFYAIPRQDTSELAHRLVDRFGTVYGVVTAPAKELMEVKGVGAKTAKWLESVGTLITTYGELGLSDRPCILNVKSTFEMCAELRRKVAAPQTYHICTTPSGTIQVVTKISDSASWCSPEPLKMALDDVLAVNARNAIIVSFFDRDEPELEDYDRKSAEQYAYLLRCMGAELLDVVLVGREKMMSMNLLGEYDRRKFGEARSILSERYLSEDAAAANKEHDADAGL